MTLEEQVVIFLEKISNLEDLIAKQALRIIIQDTRILDLEEELRKSRIVKNSSNSSKAPSSDISPPQVNQSLRPKSGKLSGGQFGHKGSTLLMSNTPDEIIELNPNYCNECGCDLSNEESHFESKRQEYDIPPIKAIVKEYRRNSKQCPCCGHCQKSEFPKHLNNATQYGSNVESLVSYLSVYHILPYNRLSELFCHIFNINISEGTIANMLRRMAVKAVPVYDKIKETILKSNQIGSDETSVPVNGIKHWIWVWQNSKATYITSSPNRGMATIESVFPDGFKSAILNTDRWAAQLKTNSAGHQLCISHLLRDLNFIEEVDKIDWATDLKKLLINGLELKKQQLEFSRDNPLVKN